MLALVCLAPLLANADAGLVVLAVPDIQRDLGLTLTGAHWVTNLYVLLVGGLQLLGGRLCDRVGARRLFLGSLAGFAAASAVCGAAPGGGVLLAARAGQAVAAALLVPAAMCMLLTVVPQARERRRALALWAACGGLGSIAGVLAGGVAVSRLDWRWAFFLNVPIALAAWAAGRWLCPPCAHGGGRAPGGARERSGVPSGVPLDVPGAVFLVGGLLAFVYGLVGIGERGVSGTTWGVLGAAVVLGALFLRRQAVAADPLLPAALWRDRSLAAGAVGIGFVAAGTGPVVFVASLYLQEAHGYSAWAAGCALLPVVGAVLVVGRPCARLLDRFGPRVPALVGCALSGAGLLMLTRVAPGSSYASGLLPGLALVGAGLPFLWMAYETAAVAGVRRDLLGSAAGVVQCAGQIGAAVGLAVVVAVYGSVAGPGSGVGADAGPGAGVGVGAGESAVGLARAFWVCAVLVGCAALTARFGLPAASRRGAAARGRRPGELPAGALDSADSGSR
ncbi:MFS transporter [Streptomyces sp. NPDC093225]|uniref:MFS transporter n=1 Tax=Streptomyces sp. NPDC093225 TaxID=3366034 RepID=UPI00382345A9